MVPCYIEQTLSSNFKDLMTYKCVVPNVFLWVKFCPKRNQEFKMLKMNFFLGFQLSKVKKNQSKNCQKSTFSFQQILRNREG